MFYIVTYVEDLEIISEYENQVKTVFEHLNHQCVFVINSKFFSDGIINDTVLKNPNSIIINAYKKDSVGNSFYYGFSLYYLKTRDMNGYVYMNDKNIELETLKNLYIHLNFSSDKKVLVFNDNLKDFPNSFEISDCILGIDIATSTLPDYTKKEPMKDYISKLLLSHTNEFEFSKTKH